MFSYFYIIIMSIIIKSSADKMGDPVHKEVLGVNILWGVLKNVLQ